jgi:hypothetical protein
MSTTPSTTNKTGLYLRGTPLDPAGKWSPQQFFEEILAHIDIVAPYGISTFVQGDQMPTSNQGPWLKGGTEWWVWDDSTGTYVPLVIDQSLPTLFYLQEATPPLDSGIQVWFQTQTVGGVVQPKAINLNLNGTEWVPIGTPRSGTFASAPTEAADWALYYATDLQVMCVWNGSSWVTQDGVIGDAKFVTWSTRYDALRHNPGWEVLWDGPAGSVVSQRGLLIGQATANADGSDPSTVSGFAVTRSALEVSGVADTEVTLLLEHLPAHLHELGISGNAGAPGQFDTAGTSDYSNPAGERVYIDDAVIGVNIANPDTHAAAWHDKYARTGQTGRAVPTPVSVPQDPPALWLFALRKVA